MPYDGSGNFTRDYNFVEDRDNDIKILAERMDGEFDNMAAALNEVVLRNGVAPMTGNLRMGSNRVTGLGAGSESSPTIGFTDSINSGLFLGAGGSVGVTVAGKQVALFDASGYKGASEVTTLVVTKSATVAEDVTVSGATKSDTLSVTKTVAVGTDLTVSGKATVSGATKSDTLSVTKTATVGTDLTVSGATKSDTLSITKTAAIGTDLTVSGKASVTGVFTAGTTLILPAVATTTDGGIWSDKTGVYGRYNGATHGPLATSEGYVQIGADVNLAGLTDINFGDLPAGYANLRILFFGVFSAFTNTVSAIETARMTVSDDGISYSTSVSIGASVFSTDEDILGTIDIPGYALRGGGIYTLVSQKSATSRLLFQPNSAGVWGWAFASGNGVKRLAVQFYDTANLRTMTAGTARLYGIRG